MRPADTPASHRFEGEGDGVIATVRYDDGKVWINPTQHFTDVSVEVWEYEVGTYQVGYGLAVALKIESTAPKSVGKLADAKSVLFWVKVSSISRPNCHKVPSVTIP